MNDKPESAAGVSSPSTELLDCPVCGCEPRINPPFFIPRWWGIICPNLDCHVGEATGKTYQDAARKWNKRRQSNADVTGGRRPSGGQKC